MPIFQKKKTPPEHIWHIDTKIISQPTEVFQKKRIQKKQTREIVHKCLSWIKNYFRTVGWLFFLGIICIVALTISMTPVFLLKAESIEIELVPEPIFDVNVIRSLMWDFVGKNVISISAGDIFEVLQANIRHISSVEKTVVFPDGIKVRVTSFLPAYRAYMDGETYLLTENGHLIPNIPELDLAEINIYHLNSHPELTQTTLLRESDVRKVSYIEKTWYTLWPTKTIQKMDFFDKEKELHIISEDVRYILTLGCFDDNEAMSTESCTETLSSRTGWVGQLQTLAPLVENKQIPINALTYIDMRIPGKIFTCARSESVCQKNINELYFY